MNAGPLLLLTIMGLLLVAMVVIIAAALMQKPTRQWRVEWHENTSDLRRTGMKTLKGEPVQPRIVPFADLLESQWGEAGVEQVMYPAPAPVHLPEPFTRKPIIPVAPEPPLNEEVAPEPELTFDEKRELGILGSCNPGAPDVSEIPEIEPGKFWVTVAALVESGRAALAERYATWSATRETKRDREPGDSESGSEGAVVFDVPPPPEPKAEPVVIDDIDDELDVAGVIEADETQEPRPEDELNNWVGGLRYLSEKGNGDQWREHVPLISEIDISKVTRSDGVETGSTSVSKEETS